MMSPRRRLQDRGFDAVVTSSRTARAGANCGLALDCPRTERCFEARRRRGDHYLEASYRPIRLATAPRLEIARILGDFLALGPLLISEGR